MLRSCARVAFATTHPWFSSPTRFSRGTRTSSKNTSLNPASPVFFGAELDQRRPDHLDAHHADESGGARQHQLLIDDRLLHHIGAVAAVLLRPAHRDVAAIVELALPVLHRADPFRVARLQR